MNSTIDITSLNYQMNIYSFLSNKTETCIKTPKRPHRYPSTATRITFLSWKSDHLLWFSKNKEKKFTCLISTCSINILFFLPYQLRKFSSARPSWPFNLLCFSSFVQSWRRRNWWWSFEAVLLSWVDIQIFMLHRSERIHKHFKLFFS